MAGPIKSVEDARRRARRRLPSSVYWFLEGGTEAEQTVRANRAAFEAVTFLPRAAVQTAPRDLRVTVLGQELSMPVVLAPVGFARLARRSGEVLAARAAGSAGIAAAVSTLSSAPIADVVRASAGPVWYQLYFAGGRDAAEAAVGRAADAGAAALVVTVDLPTNSGTNPRVRAGVPTRVDLRNAVRFAPEMVIRPRWLLDFLRDGLQLDVPNVRDAAGKALSVGEASRSMGVSAPTWDDLTWLRQSWKGPLVVKGVLRADDARRAVDAGADAVVVSNHGGNALDGTPATLSRLPAVAAAVGDDAQVLLDGGVRRGADVVRAVALGACAVLVGRPYLWGLAAGGEEGVHQVLAVLRAGIDSTLGLLGCASFAELDGSYVEGPTAPAGS